MDADLREAQRSAAQGDPEAGARHLRARVRAGTLTQDMLELAAYCGHEAARLALGWEAGGNGRVYVRNPGGCATGFPDANLLPNSIAFRNWLNGLKRCKREVETECPTCPLRGKIRPPLKRWATCRKCDGTGKVSREIPEALLRAAVACARACLSDWWWKAIDGVGDLCSTAPDPDSRIYWERREAIEAAERYLENPTEENRRACDVSPQSGLPEWAWALSREIVHGSASGGMSGAYAPEAIKSAAAILSEKTARTVIQTALIEWALA